MDVNAVIERMSVGAVTCVSGNMTVISVCSILFHFQE